jgi:hypothetical protein
VVEHTIRRVHPLGVTVHRVGSGWRSRRGLRSPTPVTAWLKFMLVIRNCDSMFTDVFDAVSPARPFASCVHRASTPGERHCRTLGRYRSRQAARPRPTRRADLRIRRPHDADDLSGRAIALSVDTPESSTDFCIILSAGPIDLGHLSPEPIRTALRRAPRPRSVPAPAGQGDRGGGRRRDCDRPYEKISMKTQRTPPAAHQGQRASPARIPRVFVHPLLQP